MTDKAFKRFFSFFGLDVKRNSARRYNELEGLGIPLDHWERRKDKYWLKEIGLSIEDLNSPVLIGYQKALRLVKNGQAKFSHHDNGQLRLEIRGVVFNITSADELYVIHEVFVGHDYNIKSSDPIVVIDIGMNIGATALFFSGQAIVKKIYSYELFQPTFDCALRNFALNDVSKIEALNFGLAGKDATLELAYSEDAKAMMGLNGLPPDLKSSRIRNVSAVIKDAASEVQRIRAIEGDTKIICKMDCEGAEFEIIERLFEADAAKLIDIYIVEWHYRDTSDVEKRFLLAGFDVIRNTDVSGITGLMYAFRK